MNDSDSSHADAAGAEPRWRCTWIDDDGVPHCRNVTAVECSNIPGTFFPGEVCDAES